MLRKFDWNMLKSDIKTTALSWSLCFGFAFCMIMSASLLRVVSPRLSVVQDLPPSMPGSSHQYAEKPMESVSKVYNKYKLIYKYIQDRYKIPNGGQAVAARAGPGASGPGRAAAAAWPQLVFCIFLVYICYVCILFEYFWDACLKPSFGLFLFVFVCIRKYVCNFILNVDGI